MPASRLREPASDGRIPVWDAAVRLLHWLLAGLVLFDLFWDDGGPLHRVVGYVAAGTVLARLLWAAFARGPGGFASLKPSVGLTLAYLRSGAPRTINHDPLGIWMVWLLWSLVLLLGLTGWMSRLDAFWGDERIQDLHAWLADAILAAVVLHVAGVAAMSWRWRENLPAAMITGRRRSDVDRLDGA
jgi:cytochrome b